jgi:hypothetical protein
MKKRRQARAVRGGILTVALATLGTAATFASARVADAVAKSNEQEGIPKPFLLIEGWLDRNYVSDLYAYSLDGKLIRRLTSEPLPTCGLVAITPGGTEVFFVANASALYGLSLRHNVLWSLHSSNAETPAVSRLGDAIAFVTRTDAPPGTTRGAVPANAAGRPLALRVRPLFAGGPSQFLLPADVVPSEMAFAPDGQHVLIANWVRGGNAQLVLANLTTGAITPVIADARFSYYQPVFAPDGKSLLAVREDYHNGRWSIVSLPWPAVRGGTGAANAPTVLLTGPLGVSLSMPIFVADGKHFLYHQEDALVRATLDGKSVEPLAGAFDQKDREWFPGMGNLGNRVRPTRPSWLPTVVTRYFARVEWHERKDSSAPAMADLIIIDVQTKERRVVPIRAGNFRAAVVVE